jgi:hypothetical protein
MIDPNLDPTESPSNSLNKLNTVHSAAHHINNHITMDYERIWTAMVIELGMMLNASD